MLRFIVVHPTSHEHLSQTSADILCPVEGTQYRCRCHCCLFITYITRCVCPPATDEQNYRRPLASRASSARWLTAAHSTRQRGDIDTTPGENICVTLWPLTPPFLPVPQLFHEAKHMSREWEALIDSILVVPSPHDWLINTILNMYLRNLYLHTYVQYPHMYRHVYICQWLTLLKSKSI